MPEDMPEKITMITVSKFIPANTDMGMAMNPRQICATPTVTMNTLALATCFDISHLSKTETSANVKALARENHIHSIGLTVSLGFSCRS